MLWITLFCVTMAILSAAFWVEEARRGAVERSMIPTYSILDKVMFSPRYIYSFRILGLDLLCTFILAGGLNIGGLTIGFQMGGVIGTTMGLAISNVISINLLKGKKRAKLTLSQQADAICA